MMIKYRVSDVAKDFGRQNKEITEILGNYLHAPRSNAQALQEPELDVIFEYLTQKNQVESLDVVFAPAAEAAAKRREESEARILKKQQENDKANPKKAAEPAAAAEAKAGKPDEVQSTKGPRITVVDTRGSSVDLAKYDERIDKLVPERPTRSARTRASKRSSARPISAVS